MMLFWIILVSICHISHSSNTYGSDNSEWVPVDNGYANNNHNSYTPSYNSYPNDNNNHNSYTPSYSTYGKNNKDKSNDYSGSSDDYSEWVPVDSGNQNKYVPTYSTYGNKNNNYNGYNQNNGYNNGYYQPPPPSSPSRPCNVSLLTNGDFETPVNAQQTPNGLENYFEYPAARTGWLTTDTDGVVEIWNAPGFTGGGAEPTRKAYSGNQWNELNADMVDTIYQVIDTTLYQGLTLTWQFAHRGRLGADTMSLLIGAGPTLGSQPTVATYTDGATDWVLHSGAYIVPLGQTSTVFALKSVSAFGNIPTYGNFIDFVSFNYTCPVPPPETPCKSSRLSYCARRCKPCLKGNDRPSFCSIYKNIQRPDHSLYLQEQDDDCVIIENVEYNDIIIGAKSPSCHVCIHVKNAKISGDFTLKHPAHYTTSMRDCHVQGNLQANDEDMECIHSVQVDGNQDRQGHY